MFQVPSSRCYPVTPTPRYSDTPILRYKVFLLPVSPFPPFTGSSFCPSPVFCVLRSPAFLPSSQFHVPGSKFQVLPRYPDTPILRYSDTPIQSFPSPRFTVSPSHRFVFLPLSWILDSGFWILCSPVKSHYPETKRHPQQDRRLAIGGGAGRGTDDTPLVY